MDSSDAEEFELDQFFPYLVRIYYRAVSDAVSNAYATQYRLSVSEWRTMAILSQNEALSASEIVSASSLDKVTVSRAIKGLLAHGFVSREIDNDDKRRSVLKLTRNGVNAFNKIMPRAKELAEACLDGLSDDERQQLIAMMRHVRTNAEKL